MVSANEEVGVVVDGFCILLSVIANEVPPFTTAAFMFTKNDVELRRVQVDEIEHKHELETVELVWDGRVMIILELVTRELTEVKEKVRLVMTPME